MASEKPLFLSGEFTVSKKSEHLLKVENKNFRLWFIEECFCSPHSEVDYYWYINGQEFRGNKVQFESEIDGEDGIKTMLSVYLKVVNNSDEEDINFSWYIKGVEKI